MLLNHFSQTYEDTKFRIIRRCPDKSDVVPAKEHT